MGCISSTRAGPQRATAEEKAVAQLKVLFESIDVDTDKTVNKQELETALKQNEKLRSLIFAATFNPDVQVLEQLDTNKDGRLSWEEFERHFKKVAVGEVKKCQVLFSATEAVEEKAETRLKEIFKAIDTNKDNVVDSAELTSKLNAKEGDGFKTLLKDAGVNTKVKVRKQLDANKDGKVTWPEFHGKLKGAAQAQVQATGHVRGATQIEIEGATQIEIEGEGTSKSNCCC